MGGLSGGRVNNAPDLSISVTEDDPFIASPDEPSCLVGWDNVNAFRITLGGPRLTLDIE
jgi:hypothetical protein